MGNLKNNPTSIYGKTIEEEKKKNPHLFKQEVNTTLENVFFAAKHCNIYADNAIIDIDGCNTVQPPSLGGLIMMIFNLITLVYRLTPPANQATLPDKGALLEAATRLFLVKAPGQPIDQLLFRIEEPDYFGKRDFENEVAEILEDSRGERETVGGRMLLAAAQTAKVMVLLAEDRLNGPAFYQREEIPAGLLGKLSEKRQRFYYASEVEALRYITEYMPLDDNSLITKILIMAIIQSNNGQWYNWSE